MTDNAAREFESTADQPDIRALVTACRRFNCAAASLW